MTYNDDDDEIAYFTVHWKTRELVLSTAPKHQCLINVLVGTEPGPSKYESITLTTELHQNLLH